MGQSKKKTVLDAMDRDREKFLNILFPDSGEVVIALHNNFKGYNVKLEIPKSDTVSIKKDQTPETFIYVRIEETLKFFQNLPLTLFCKKVTLKRRWFLSWAAVKWGVRYVNIETRLGWLSMQKRMLRYANEHLPKE